MFAAWTMWCQQSTALFSPPVVFDLVAVLVEPPPPGIARRLQLARKPLRASHPRDRIFFYLKQGSQNTCHQRWVRSNV